MQLLCICDFQFQKYFYFTCILNNAHCVYLLKYIYEISRAIFSNINFQILYITSGLQFDAGLQMPL